jgi:hypothetical protein
MLARLWAGIVGAVAGAAIGLAVLIVLTQNRAPLNTALWAAYACVALGFVVCFAIGRTGKTK